MTYMVRKRPVRVAFIILTLIFFGTLTGFAIVLSVQSDLATENQNRITDIQASRVESCKRTYSGIKEVLEPFFPKEPTTQQQAQNIEKFNVTINKLKKGCTKQTDPKEVSE